MVSSLHLHRHVLNGCYYEKQNCGYQDGRACPGYNSRMHC